MVQKNDKMELFIKAIFQKENLKVKENSFLKMGQFL